jgi:hypothetical protein
MTMVSLSLFIYSSSHSHSNLIKLTPMQCNGSEAQCNGLTWPSERRCRSLPAEAEAATDDYGKKKETHAGEKKPCGL